MYACENVSIHEYVGTTILNYDLYAEAGEHWTGLIVVDGIYWRLLKSRTEPYSPLRN